MLPQAGIFGIHNNTVSLAIELLILFLVVIWLALVYWTFADARRRIADPLLIACATAASLFPYVGTIVYMIVRPPEYLDDVRERELEMQAAEARLAEIGYHLCPHCDYEVEKDYLRCPSCMRKLKDPCKTCGKPLDPAWKVCPYCETELGAAPAPRRTRRRRESSPAEPQVGNAGSHGEPGPIRGTDPVGAPGAVGAPTERSRYGGVGSPPEHGDYGTVGAPVERGGPSAS